MSCFRRSFSKYLKKSSALVLNPKVNPDHVFQIQIYTFRIFIRSSCCFSFLSLRGARGHAVVVVSDPFSDLPVFFGSEESIGCEM